jgi:hypothetical protein
VKNKPPTDPKSVSAPLIVPLISLGKFL